MDKKKQASLFESSHLESFSSDPHSELMTLSKAHHTGMHWSQPECDFSQANQTGLPALPERWTHEERNGIEIFDNAVTLGNWTPELSLDPFFSSDLPSTSNGPSSVTPSKAYQTEIQ